MNVSGLSPTSFVSVTFVNGKLNSLTDMQMELISTQIVSRISCSLGPAGKGRAMQQQHGAGASPAAKLMMQLLNKRGQQQFLSVENEMKFLGEGISVIGEEIKKAFSNPESFLRDGVLLKLSESGTAGNYPIGSLQEIAAKISLTITGIDVPDQYRIRLKLDPEATQQKNNLVFSLTEESQHVELSKITFTIQELEEDFKV